jgi:hypothetical protein
MIRWRRPAASNPITDISSQDRTLQDRDNAVLQMVAAIQLAVQAWQAVSRANQRAEAALELMLVLVEPGEVDGCHKVRLRSREEAEAFAERVLQGTGERCVPHKCRHCPRQPVSLEKFWHITTEDRSRRGKRRGPHQHSARLLRHVSPEHADLLRARLGLEVS